MVESLLADPRAYISILRCPKSEGCPCRLCPLDPFLKERPVPKGLILCHWYETANIADGTGGIPEFLFRPLIVYTLYLLKIGVLTIDGSNTSG